MNSVRRGLNVVLAAVLVAHGAADPALAGGELCESSVACWAVTPIENQLAECGEVVSFKAVRKFAARDLKRAAKLTKAGEIDCAETLVFYVALLFDSIPKAPPASAPTFEP